MARAKGLVMSNSIKDIEWVSNHTGVPVNTLRYYRQRGEGPRSFKLGRRVMYAVEDVEAWIDAARKVGASA